MNTCGNSQFLDGGTINNAHLINPNITGAYITNSELNSSTITQLKDIDQQSIEAIVRGIIDLPAAQKTLLMQELMKSFSVIASVPAPTPVDDGTVSTKVYGNKDGTLGGPAAWVDMGSGYSAPLYTKATP